MVGRRIRVRRADGMEAPILEGSLVIVKSSDKPSLLRVVSIRADETAGVVSLLPGVSHVPLVHISDLRRAGQEELRGLHTQLLAYALEIELAIATDSRADLAEAISFPGYVKTPVEEALDQWLALNSNDFGASSYAFMVRSTRKAECSCCSRPVKWQHSAIGYHVCDVHRDLSIAEWRSLSSKKGT
jgi:hypothetical protein